jgi:hypothetical protein
MKKVFIRSILIILIALMVGCEKTGYIVIVKTNRIKYDDLQQIGRMLEDKGFKTVVWERKNDMSKYPGQIYTVLEKKLISKPYYVVDIDLNYAKDLPNNFVHNLRIDVSNVYKGITITELKDEIDKIGDLIYQEVVNKVGERNVVIERKETNNQAIFF